MSERIQTTCEGGAVRESFGWDSVQDVFAMEGGRVFAQSGTSSTVRVSAGEDGEFFLKRYDYPRFAVHHLFRASRPRREWRSLQTMTHLGLLVPEPIVWGEERRLRRLVRGFLVTRAIADGFDLESHLKHRPRPSSGLVIAFAEAVAAMHGQGFAHGDLYLRNVVVQVPNGDEPRFYFLDAPNGRGGRRPRSAGMIRDLANLDLDASRYLDAGRRYLFLRHYLAPETGRPDRILLELLMERVARVRRSLARQAERRAARRARRSRETTPPL